MVSFAKYKISNNPHLLSKVLKLIKPFKANPFKELISPKVNYLQEPNKMQ